MATYNGIKKIKIGDNIFNLYDSGNSGGTITSVKTTAGAHSTINVTSGAANFNVPTTAAHVGIKFGYTTSGNNRAVLQDSSGNLYVTQKDDNSNTTYALSGALSSHKFTSTLTAGGSGSGTSTSDFTLAAGTGITITDDTSARKMTIACSVTNTDAKVTQSATTTSDWRKVLLHYTTNSNNGDVPASVTNQVYAAKGIEVQPSTGTLNISGDYKVSATNKGYFVVDSTGFAYPAIKDNGTNLWIGSTQTVAQHHKGETFISSGYDGTKGNATIKISIPTTTNDDANNYEIWHANHQPVNYCTCSTAAATAAKVATVTGSKTFSLTTGIVIGVKFTNTNTFSATADSHVTLNVNSTGAKNIYYGSGLPTGTNTTAFGRANYINYYMYDGSQWVWLSSSADNNTTYYLQTYTTRQTNADAAWHSNSYIKYLLATSSMTTNKPTFTGDGVAKRTSDGMILHLSWDNNGGWDTQIAIPNSGGMISTRGGTGKDGDVQAWTDWVSYARADKAISNITRSGTTFTATRADGTTFTFTQQDNNTTALTSMTGTLAIGHGGTGQTTAVNAANALIDALDTATANWTDNTLVLTSDVSGDTNVYYKRAATSAWNYIINKVYPVGAIYMSVNSTNPGTLFGGTWVAWGTGRVPVGINTSDTDFKTVEKTGGAKTVTLGLANVGAVNASTEASGFGLTAASAFQNRVVVSTSSATAHSNLQPYITCYMWKRTA